MKDEATTPPEGGLAGLRARFSLLEGRASPEEIDARLRADVAMQGGNLWVLVAAIFIASIGLNVNSPAVIIGAMLISPLMGPIGGMGYGAGIADLALIRRSFRNLAIAVAIALLASTAYFLVSPLRVAHSELLARTLPTIWDVLIATFGGLAGIIGATRKHPSNVVPGVAIATALMPPLCTAGYGLATAQWSYFLGALYLFTINSVFIAAAAALVTGAYRLPHRAVVDAATGRRINTTIAAIIVVTMLPSLYLAYRLVQSEIFTSRASGYIRQALETPATHVADVSVDPGARRVSVSLVGAIVDKPRLAQVRAGLGDAGLPGVDLRVFQAADATIDVSSLRSGFIEDLYRKGSEALAAREAELRELRGQLARAQAREQLADGIAPEVHALFPQLDRLQVAIGKDWSAGAGAAGVDSLVVVAASRRPLGAADRGKLAAWLRQRTGIQAVRILVDAGEPRPSPH